ncbi:unnamed protein product [Brassica napus]|uniref:(rape) hypothetical protein n=1 Tax=Brassica napus TaxID=3708 RepID=A0A816I6S9_BRANA|nr:unnamed protein product [Brassica napus]
MVVSDSRPMRLHLRAELFLASFAHSHIRSEEEGGAYISKYIKGILKSRLSRREQSHWNIIDDITSMAFLKNFRLLIQFFILSYFTGGYTLLLVE